ncbi:hypothetical protein ACNIU2_26740, partial [Escherichia coli]
MDQVTPELQRLRCGNKRCFSIEMYLSYSFVSASLFHTRHTSSRSGNFLNYDGYRVMLSWVKVSAVNEQMAWIL